MREFGTAWDGDGNMKTITLPGNQLTQPDPNREHQFTFTPVDLSKTYTPPSIGTGLPSTTYNCNTDNFLTSILTPNNITVTHTPDAFQRLASIGYPQGTLSYAYSASTGQLQTTTTPAGEVTTFAYDGFLPKSITWSGPVAGSIGFTYTPDFRVASQSINSGTAFPFGYDADTLLTCAGASTCPASGALSINWDFPLGTHNGLLNGSTLGNVTDTYTYDANGLLATYTAKYNGSAIYTETIVSRYADNRIQEKTDALGGTTHDWKYTYDPAGRLTDVTEDGTAVSHYGYDGDDNRTTVGVGTQTHPSYDNQDRLSSYPSLNATYQYSANGELTSKTAGSQFTSYIYDVLGNLLHVGFSSALPDGTTTVDYIVDGQNRRVGRKVNGTLTQEWLYQDALRPAAQLDGSGSLKATFIYGSKRNVPDYFITSGGTYRIVSDHLGSPRLVVDVNSGSVIETINYDEFGIENDVLAPSLPTGYVRIPFGFAGGMYDPDTTLVRFGARDYDASVGRWTSKDPIRFRGGLNLLIYASNDPVNRVDSTGKLSGCSIVCSATVRYYTAGLGLATGPGWGAWALGSILCSAVCDPDPEPSHTPPSDSGLCTPEPQPDPPEPMPDPFPEVPPPWEQPSN